MSTFGRRRDLGNAISIEDALAMLTVIFVVFMLLLVPLVNLDRTKLASEHRDRFWQRVAQSFALRDSGSTSVSSYNLAFDINDALSIRMRPGESENVRYIEALLADSSLTIIRHDHRDDSFIALFCQNAGTTKIYRSGSLTWNPASREWVAFEFDIDYGDKNESLAMEAKYRTWFLETTGIDG